MGGPKSGSVLDQRIGRGAQLDLASQDPNRIEVRLRSTWQVLAFPATARINRATYFGAPAIAVRGRAFEQFVANSDVFSMTKYANGRPAKMLRGSDIGTNLCRNPLTNGNYVGWYNFYIQGGAIRVWSLGTQTTNASILENAPRGAYIYGYPATLDSDAYALGLPFSSFYLGYCNYTGN